MLHRRRLASLPCLYRVSRKQVVIRDSLWPSEQFPWRVVFLFLVARPLFPGLGVRRPLRKVGLLVRSDVSLGFQFFCLCYLSFLSLSERMHPLSDIVLITVFAESQVKDRFLSALEEEASHTCRVCSGCGCFFLSLLPRPRIILISWPSSHLC